MRFVIIHISLCVSLFSTPSYVYSSLTRGIDLDVQALKEESDAKNPGRMELIEMDSFTWEAYTEAAKHLQDVPSVPWGERESSLFAHQTS